MRTTLNLSAIYAVIKASLVVEKYGQDTDLPKTVDEWVKFGV